MITSTKVGSNTWALDISTGETSSSLLTEVGNVLTSGGWTVEDATEYVYKAPNVDTVTYKYIRLSYDSTTSNLNLDAGKGYDSTNSVLTDQFTATVSQTIDFSYNNRLYLMCTTKWFVMLNYNVDTATWGQPERHEGFSGLFEVSRFHTEDTPGLNDTCFILTDGKMITGLEDYYFSIETNNVQFINTFFGAITKKTLPLTGASRRDKLADIIPNGSDPYTGEIFISDIFVGWDFDASQPNYKGYIYGLKILQEILPFTPENMDEVNIPCNSDGFFDPQNGTNLLHRFLYNNYDPANGVSRLTFVLPD